ncbi:MAG: Fatty acid metabolism regulator protein [Pelotomaculum sp. PtaU1.Bin065]|nr:MAG: Fatty acid metabolism regulator protein [Pelotomaculum sp. PtaU1.Bin065]
MTRITKDPEIRKAELIEAAEELFRTKGYHQTSVSDIVKNIGVAQGTFYYYFETKEDVLETIISRIVTRIINELEDLVNNQSISAKEKICLIANSFFRDLRDEKSLLLVLFDEKQLHLMAKIENHAKKLAKPILLKVFNQGQKDGAMDVPYPEDAFDFFVAILLCIVESSLEENKENKFKILARKMFIGERLIEKTLGIKEGALQLTGTI